MVRRGLGKEIKREERDEMKREEMVVMKERVDRAVRDVKVELERDRRKGVVEERRGKGRGIGSTTTEQNRVYKE